MLNIYQEFVRNHQYSLKILAHCKQNQDFYKLLKQYEAKPDCEERTLETFLTYPMFQVTVVDLQGSRLGRGHSGRSWQGAVPLPKLLAGGEQAQRHAPARPGSGEGDGAVPGDSGTHAGPYGPGSPM